MLLMIPIGFFNRYIFTNGNLLVLGMLVTLSALLLTRGRLPCSRAFSAAILTFLVFVFYAWSRLDDPFAFDIDAQVLETYASGSMMVLEQLIYLLLFVASAVIYAKTRKFNRFLWFVICIYIVMFILRQGFDLEGLRTGYNLSPGFVLISLLPFTFLQARSSHDLVLPVSLSLLCIFWLGLIGSRSAFISITIFLIAFYLWPWMTKTRRRYNLVFFGLSIGIVALYVIYLTLTVSEVDFALSADGDSMFNILNKRIGTRLDIWRHLVYLISLEPVIGYGMDAATMLVSPVPHLEFGINRNDLSAHSLYLEILYRLGVMGLLLFTCFMFMLWRLFWIGRMQLIARIGAAYLAALLLFSSTADFIVLTTMSLQSGFVWCFLGIAAGASLRAKADAGRMHCKMADKEISYGCG